MRQTASGMETREGLAGVLRREIRLHDKAGTANMERRQARRRARSARFPASGLRRLSSRQFQLAGTSRHTDWRLQSLLTRPLESGRYRLA
jgi:hypothetical protein